MKQHRGQFASSKSSSQDTSFADGQSSQTTSQEEPGLSLCQHCGISKDSTPVMQRGQNGPGTLCNACGLMWANKNGAKRKKLTNQKLTNEKFTRTQRNEDVILILKSIIKFKAQHGGSNPSRCNMKPLFDSIKPKLHQSFNYNSFYRKIVAIKEMYEKALVEGVGPTEYDHEMFELSVRMWDQDGEVRKKMEARKKEEACNDFARLKDAMNKHWEDNGLCKKDLEVGLELMDKEIARILEKKWKALMKRDAKVKKARLELDGEIRKFVDSEFGEDSDESGNVDENEGAV